jgi:hypothetical protein
MCASVFGRGQRTVDWPAAPVMRPHARTPSNDLSQFDDDTTGDLAGFALILV